MPEHLTQEPVNLTEEYVQKFKETDDTIMALQQSQIDQLEQVNRMGKKAENPSEKEQNLSDQVRTLSKKNEAMNRDMIDLKKE